MSSLASYFQANYFCASAWATADAAMIRRYMNICSNLKITGFYSAIIPDFLHLILVKVRQSDSFDQRPASTSFSISCIKKFISM